MLDTDHRSPKWESEVHARRRESRVGDTYQDAENSLVHNSSGARFSSFVIRGIRQGQTNHTVYVVMRQSYSA